MNLQGTALENHICPILPAFLDAVTQKIDTLQASSKQMQLNTIKPFQPHYNCHTEDCRLNFQLPCHVALPWRSRQRHPDLRKWSLAQSINPMERMPQKGFEARILKLRSLWSLWNKSLVKMGQYQVQWKHVITLTRGLYRSVSLSLSLYLPVYPCIYLPISLSISLSILLPVHAPIHLPYSLILCLSACLSIYPSIHPSYVYI